MRTALLVLVCWLYGLPLARADEGKVLAVDHLIHVATDIVVQSRWKVDGRVRAGEVFGLRWPLARETSLESADVLAERDASGRIVRLRTRRDLDFALELSTRVRAAYTSLPVASPQAHVVERIRSDVPARVQLQHAAIEQHFGIRMSEHIRRAERERADDLLGGPLSHRRFGALYFYGADGPLSLSRAHEARRTWGRYGALLVFALCLASVVRALARARRSWQREQRTAYLKQALSAEDREFLGLEDGEES